MAKAVSNFMLLMFLAAALVGCSSSNGGGGGGGNGPPGPSPDSDVSIEQLEGAWLGGYDPDGNVRTMQLTIQGSDITELQLDGAATNLTGTITKADEVQRVFRFVLTDNQAVPFENRGAFMVDPSATYLVFLGQFLDFGVIQKDATELPTFAQTDIDGSWTGHTISTTGFTDTGFDTFAHTPSSATCAPSEAPVGPSDCTVALNGTTRAIASLTANDTGGRWVGTYTDTREDETQESGTTQVYLSPDRAFAGSWSCVNFAAGPGGFPETCDFSAWTRGESGNGQNGGDGDANGEATGNNQ